MINLSAVEGWLLQAAGIAVLTVVSLTGRIILKQLHLQFSEAQKAELEDVAGKALTWGITKASELIKAKGWDHLDSQNLVINAAGAYAVTQFPDAMKRAGIDLTDPLVAAAQLTGILTRKFPEIATLAATRVTIAPLAPGETGPPAATPLTAPVPAGAPL